MKKLILGLLLTTTIAYGCPTLREDMIDTLFSTKEMGMIAEMNTDGTLTHKEAIVRLERIKRYKTATLKHILASHSKESGTETSAELLKKELLGIEEFLIELRSRIK